MAAASQKNFRSISLPSRLHPVNSTGYESELRKLDSCFSDNAPVTSEAIQSGILALAELYNSLPLNQHQDRKSVEDSLESSAQLLDSCNTIRELIQMIRENVQALQSAFRRKGLTSTAVQSDLDSYFRSRKKMSKCISKSLRALKNLENTTSGRGADEAMTTTIAVFRSSLVFLSLPAARSCRWNFVSRLTTKARSAGIIDGAISEVGCVDSALNGLRHGESSKVQRSLRNLDACVEGIEVGLQRLFRQLLQSRVALLNILTDH